MLSACSLPDSKCSLSGLKTILCCCINETPLNDFEITMSLKLQESPSKIHSEFGIAAEIISLIISLSTYPSISRIRNPPLKSGLNISIIFGSQSLELISKSKS